MNGLFHVSIINNERGTADQVKSLFLLKTGAS